MLIKKSIFSCLFLICMVFLYADDNLIANHDFSQFEGNGKPAGWTMGSNFSVLINGGENGNCLAFENKSPETYHLCVQNINCRPGDIFVFGTYVKTENMTGEDSGATVCLEWYDKEGKFRGGDYPSGKKGNTPNWTLIHMRSGQVPEGVNTARFALYARKGMVGKAWFDRPYCRLFQPELVGPISVAPYRGITDGKELEITVALNLRPLRIEPKDVSGQFEIVDAAGKTVLTQKAEGIELTQCTAKLDIASLPAGKYTVKANFECKSKKGSAQRTFTKAAKLDYGRCYIDEYKRLIADGQPFFPLGLYVSNAAEADLKVIGASPFNCIMAYGPPGNIEGMDKISENGLKIIYSIKDAYPGTKWCPKSINTDEDAVNFIEKRVKDFAKHPALIAWYINDELPLSMIDKLVARRDLMEKLDPDHPTWVVLYQYTQISEYLNSFDIIGTDPYPIPGKGAYEAARWTRMTRDGAFKHHAVWQVPQIFNWACYRKGPAAIGCRKPTLAEIKCMFWLCIANGANGLIPYSYYDLKKPANGVPFEEAWAEVCEAGEMVKKQIPVLLSVEPAPTVSVNAEKIDTRTWHYNGADYVLVVNGNDKPVEVEVTVGATATKATAEFGPAPALKSNSFTLKLAGFEPAFVKLVP